MLVDDHRLLRDALRAVLEREADIEVVGEAGDGRSAVALAGQLLPDVVVMDVAMPELNGTEASARLRARFPDMKIIALSAYDDKRYVVQMLRAGASGYVIKAAAGTELLRAIRAVSKGSNYLCPEVASTLASSFTAPLSLTENTSPELGRREREVLKLIAEGHRSTAIAGRMSISVATVEAHRRNVMRKLDLHSVAELTRFAIREGLIQI